VNKSNLSLLKHGSKTEEWFFREVNLVHMKRYRYSLFTETDYEVTVDRCILDTQYKDEKVKIDYELDGPLHFTLKDMEHDRKRDAYIKNQGYRVQRLSFYGTLPFSDILRGVPGTYYKALFNLQDVFKQALVYRLLNT
jgi:hypothetical protein